MDWCLHAFFKQLYSILDYIFLQNALICVVISVLCTYIYGLKFITSCETTTGNVTTILIPPNVQPMFRLEPSIYSKLKEKKKYCNMGEKPVLQVFFFEQTITITSFLGRAKKLY